MAAPDSRRRIPAGLVLLPLFLALSARLVYGAGFSGTGFGLSGIQGHIGCFGDFNSDKRTDVFVISNDLKTVQVYFWTHDGYIPSAAKITSTSGSILSVIASDYNYDGRLDVAIYGRTPSSSFYLDIFLGHLTSFETTAAFSISSLQDQPLLMDYNGDMKVDLLAKTDTTSSTRTVFTSVVTDGKVSFSSKPLPGVPTSASPLSTPHSNAFVDLTGDCVADLFLSTMDSSSNPIFEVWTNDPAADGSLSPFSLTKTYRAPKGAGQVSFMDVDADGTIDAVFPVCWPADTCTTENSIHILYNQQGDRSSDNLCQGQDLGFEADWSTNNATARHVVVTSSAFGPNIRFATGTLTTDSATQIPTSARLGDADMDGFPDALVLVRRTASLSPSDGTISPDAFFQLWMNIPCTEALCGIDAFNAGRRTFAYSQQGKSNVETATGAFAAAWVDLSDNGQLDLIVLSSKSGNRTMSAWENSFDEDAYFLTSLGLNGVCNAWCSSGEKFPDPKPYGVNMPGITTKFTVTSLSGTRYPRVGAQLAQSAYLALQTPYTYFGIGRTNNYIEYFYMGTPSHPREVGGWVAIIPNSQLILFPYPIDDPLNWTLELFISPSASMALVAGSLGVTLFVLGATIVYFHMKEKKEDELDKQTEQLIAF